MKLFYGEIDVSYLTPCTCILSLAGIYRATCVIHFVKAGMINRLLAEGQSPN